MSSGMSFDTSRLDRGFAQLARNSTRSDSELVKFNSIDIVKSIAFNSPRRSGNMNAGWWPAYAGLNIAGSPNTRRTSPHRQGKRRLYVPEGSFVDNSKSSQPTIEFSNKSHAIINGKRVNYPFIVDARTAFMDAAEKEVAQKVQRRLERQYRKLLRNF